MLRAAMIRQEAAGSYAWLPLGVRVLHKICAIVREEQDRAGAIEVLMPTIQSADLWRESGRYDDYGKEMLRIRDRHDRDMLYGPTNEEMITEIFRASVRSYKDLPLNLYHIQWKFRDEIRPRFGLMRGREFLMKDAYSFHTGPQSLDETYEAMRGAYCRIFEACELDYTVVEADTGAIGGSASHEFMVVAETGESAVVRCPACGYAATVEKAETRGLPAGAGIAAAAEAPRPLAEAPRPLAEVATPGQHTVEEVARFLGVAPARVVKTLVYEAEKG